MENAAAGAMVLLLAAEAASGQIPYFGESVAVVGTLGALLVLWRFQKSIIGPLERRAASTDRRLSAEARQRRECEWRFAELVQHLRTEEGLAIPDRILYGRPPWEARDDG